MRSYSDAFIKKALSSQDNSWALFTHPSKGPSSIGGGPLSYCVFYLIPIASYNITGGLKWKTAPFKDDIFYDMLGVVQRSPYLCKRHWECSLSKSVYFTEHYSSPGVMLFYRRIGWLLYPSVSQWIILPTLNATQIRRSSILRLEFARQTGQGRSRTGISQGPARRKTIRQSALQT